MLGCYGDKTIQSPNIDRLAARGVVFDHAYCNQAVCAPSRNMLVTGVRPATLESYHLGTIFRRAEPDAVTLTQHFVSTGWRTEGIGKFRMWDLGIMRIRPSGACRIFRCPPSNTPGRKVIPAMA